MGSIEGFKYNNDLYYYIKNGQNDIIGIIDDEGNQVVSYTYDSWGQITSITDNLGNEITDPTHIGNINPFRYRSYYYDQETELYYLNSRYYNPEMSRFINFDSYGGQIGGLISHNSFAYTSNNPVNRSDPHGYAWYNDAWNWMKKTTKKISNGVKNIFKSDNSNNTTKVSAVAITGTIAVLDGPLPIGDILALTVLNFALSYPNTMTVDISRSNSSISNKPCTKASIVGGDVRRGDRLTIEDSVTNVRLGGNVMCDDETSAWMVAMAFPNHLGPETDVNQKPGNTYYPHYHPDRNSHRHIWFYPAP